MTDIHITRRASREAAAHLGRLGHNERLELADRKMCLMAAEWLAHVHELQTHLENAEAFLNDEIRRHETALAQLSRRVPPQHRPLRGEELLTQLRQLKAELESTFPSSPRSHPFATAAA